VSAPATKPATKELRGAPLEVLATLLNGFERSDEVLAVVAKLVARNRELELLLGKLRESKNRGERMSRDQLDLFLKEAAQEASDEELAAANQQLAAVVEEHRGRPEETKPPKQPAVRRPPPRNLRRVDNPIPVAEAERACPSCGDERTCVTHETTEVIDFIPPEVIVRLDHREVLACAKCDGEMTRAPIGDKVVEGGAYGSALVGDLLVGKYRDGLPLHRQGQRYKRLGLEIPSSSMSDQIQWATELLVPIWRYLLDRVITAALMHLDATSLPVRDRDGPKGIVTGALWGYVGVNGREAEAAYVYNSTGKKVGQREGELGPEQLLALRKGPTCADASGLFDASFRRSDLVEVGCNMHARRYFKKALDGNDARAGVPLAAFAALYDVEASVEAGDVAGLTAARASRSRPVYEELIAWCETHQPVEPPASQLGRAIAYLLRHRVALTRFLDDGALPIDNGVVERLHRVPALTRKNFLFAGSHAAAERAAVAYTILGSCTLADVNPVEYLADVLPRLARGVVIARDIPLLTPAAWKAARLVAAPSTI
jgi:transposase